MYLVVCESSWTTWTWALYKEIRVDQFAFFYMLTRSWTSTMCWKSCLLAPCERSSEYRSVGSFLGLKFYSIDLPSCLCINNMQYLSLKSLRSGMVNPTEVLLLLRILSSILGFLLHDHQMQTLLCLCIKVKISWILSDLGSFSVSFRLMLNAMKACYIVIISSCFH